MWRLGAQNGKYCHLTHICKHLWFTFNSLIHSFIHSIIHNTLCSIGERVVFRCITPNAIQRYDEIHSQSEHSHWQPNDWRETWCHEARAQARAAHLCHRAPTVAVGTGISTYTWVEHLFNYCNAIMPCMHMWVEPCMHLLSMDYPLSMALRAIRPLTSSGAVFAQMGSECSTQLGLGSAFALKSCVGADDWLLWALFRLYENTLLCSIVTTLYSVVLCCSKALLVRQVSIPGSGLELQLTLSERMSEW